MKTAIETTRADGAGIEKRGQSPNIPTSSGEQRRSIGKRRNVKARREAGFNVAVREAKAAEQNSVFECDAKHISKVVKELHDNGAGLSRNGKESQVSTLLKALKLRGARGLNTYEGTAAGYARLATRIQDLEDAGWLIDSTRENLIGPDGLYHTGIARYVLIGKRTGKHPAQLQLVLEAV